MFQNLSTFVPLGRPVLAPQTIQFDPLGPATLTQDLPLWTAPKGSEECQKWIFGLEWNELKNENSETEAGAGYTRDNIC